VPSGSSLPAKQIWSVAVIALTPVALRIARVHEPTMCSFGSRRPSAL
jgi:hypothetical protein